jgi:hypothetical protein
MNEVGSFLNQIIFGNSVRAWAFAAAAFLATFTVLPLVQGFVSSRLRRLDPAKSPVGLELAKRLVGRTTRIFMWATALWLG